MPAMNPAAAGTTSVSERVLDALQTDPRMKDAVIDATYHQGTITLSGTVNSHEMHAAADEIARQQEGVITVINDLRVR
jgi:osmotically-inducible protein OsmY